MYFACVYMIVAFNRTLYVFIKIKNLIQLVERSEHHTHTHLPAGQQELRAVSVVRWCCPCVHGAFF